MFPMREKVQSSLESMDRKEILDVGRERDAVLGRVAERMYQAMLQDSCTTRRTNLRLMNLNLE